MCGIYKINKEKSPYELIDSLPDLLAEYLLEGDECDGLNSVVHFKPFLYVEASKEEYEQLYFAFRDLDSMVYFLGQFLEKHTLDYEVDVSNLIEKLQEIEGQENGNLFLAIRFLDNCVVTNIVDKSHQKISGCDVIFDLD